MSSVVVGAMFSDGLRARDAVSDLRGFGISPDDINIGELNSVGLMFGTAQTMVPGTDGFNKPRFSLFPRRYPNACGASCPEGLVAESTEDALALMEDMGLPEDLARKAGEAMLGGEILLAVRAPKQFLAHVGGLLLKNKGTILLHWK